VKAEIPAAASSNEEKIVEKVILYAIMLAQFIPWWVTQSLGKHIEKIDNLFLEFSAKVLIMKVCADIIKGGPSHEDSSASPVCRSRQQQIH